MFQTCQSDLVRDTSHKYFITMVGDTTLPFEHRTMAVFVLANIVRNYRPGQQAALQSNSITMCLEALGQTSFYFSLYEIGSLIHNFWSQVNVIVNSEGGFAFVWD